MGGECGQDARGVAVVKKMTKKRKKRDTKGIIVHDGQQRGGKCCIFAGGNGEELRWVENADRMRGWGVVVKKCQKRGKK